MTSNQGIKRSGIESPPRWMELWIERCLWKVSLSGCQDRLDLGMPRKNPENKKSPKTPKQTSGLTYLQWLGFYGLTLFPGNEYDFPGRKSQEVSHQISASGPWCTWSRSHLWGASQGRYTKSLPCHHGFSAKMPGHLKGTNHLFFRC